MDLEQSSFAVAFLSLLIALVTLIRERRANKRVSVLEAIAKQQELRNRRVEAIQLQAEILFLANTLAFRYQCLVERTDAIKTPAQSTLSGELLQLKTTLRSRLADFNKAGDEAQQKLAILADYERLTDKDLQHFDRTCAKLRIAKSAMIMNGTEALIGKLEMEIARLEEPKA